MPTSKDLLGLIKNGQTADAVQAFSDLMTDRVNAKIEDHKPAVAASLFPATEAFGKDDDDKKDDKGDDKDSDKDDHDKDSDKDDNDDDEDDDEDGDYDDDDGEQDDNADNDDDKDDDKDSDKKPAFVKKDANAPAKSVAPMPAIESTEVQELSASLLGRYVRKGATDVYNRVSKTDLSGDQKIKGVMNPKAPAYKKMAKRDNGVDLAKRKLFSTPYDDDAPKVKATDK